MKKKQIRQHYKDLRKKFSSQELETYSKQIFDEVVANFDLAEKKISIFLPIERFREINTWHFIDQLPNTFYLPVIRGENELVHIRYEGREQIEVSDWGIPEPTRGESVSESDLDLVLVPLLAIDESGYRVGYGKGFYDRFLDACREDCLFIGLSYFEPIASIADLHENDIPLHYCVYPKGTIKF